MNEFKVASMLSKVQISELELTTLRGFMEGISTNEDAQKSFYSYCEKWKLAPWFYTQLNRTQLFSFLNPETREKFFFAHQKTKEANERRNKAASEVLQAFNEQGIDVIILKGNYFAHAVYEDSGYKRMNDFDLLIRMEDWDRIQDVYMSLGFIPLGFGWSGEKQKAAKFSHVGMSFISPDFSCIVGSQWGLKSPTAGFKVNIAEAWETALPFEFYGIRVKRLSVEYNLLHLILHMGIYKCGIRDCMDVYNCISYEKPDHSKFLQILQSAKAQDKAYFTLVLSNVCSHSLQSLINGIEYKRSFTTRRLEKRLNVQNQSGDFQNSYNDYFQDIEKVVIYFNLFPLFHKKLMYYLVILKLIFLPKSEIALKLSDHAHDATFGRLALARIKAPYYIFALIAQEIGWRFTFLLFTKLFLDLWFSLKNYFIKAESYFDYLRKKAIDPKEIEKVVKNIH